MRYKLLIEYDGTPFAGWQRQKDGLGIQTVLENALRTALRHEAPLFGSGRTDAGVHAFGQVAHFDSPLALDPDRLRASLNALVRPHPVSVRDVSPVSDDFHARFSARARRYLYRIQNTRYPPALNAGRTWWISLPLAVDPMREAATLLIGKHDFSTFRASHCQANSPIKTLDSLTVTRQDDMILIEAQARSFLHHQVRNMVGALAAVGRGKWSVDDFKAAFDARDRTKGAETAPACGLYFMEVFY